MSSNRLLFGVTAIALLSFAFAVVRTAWMGDDAYIALRTVDNLIHGYGICWNVADRVQTYTSVLWLFVCALGRWLTGEYYYTVLSLAGLCTAICLLLLRAVARGGMASFAALLLVALGSRTFTDYCTGGLENPLSHALAATFLFVWYRVDDPLRRMRWLAVVGGIVACTRMDLSLLVVPPLLAAARTVPRRQAAAALAVGALPFLAWVAFAFFYYGSPFPSTAYSKAFCTGLPPLEVAAQGCRYFVDTALRDPATALVILGGLLSTLPRAGRRGLPLALGVGLYFLYIVKIGGCFMAGRFLSAPFVVCLGILLVRTREWSERAKVLGGLCAFAVACTVGLPAVIVGTPHPADELTRWNIHDVRTLAWDHTGLCSPVRALPNAGVLTTMMRTRGETRPLVYVNGVVGERGFNCGPLIHIVDFWLCDPVLSHLPTIAREKWVISHFARRIPEGYLEFVATGDTRYCNPHLARFVNAMTEVTRGELWSWHRLGVAFDLLRGAYADDLATFVAEDYFTPPLRTVPASDLARKVGADTWWFRENGRVIYSGGLDVVFDAPQHGSELELVLETGTRYYCEWRDGERVLGKGSVLAEGSNIVGLKPLRLAIPPDAQGFTTMRLSSDQRADHVSAVAAVRVIP